ncbi:helix-turn-helix transcriptional regulator [bacterium]|nr:helix-turn-helix transcriptional regulator [bacterium]
MPYIAALPAGQGAGQGPVEVLIGRIELLFAILLDAQGRLWRRHECGQEPCPHAARGWIPSQGWTGDDGRVAPQLDIFDVPVDGITFTRYTTPGRHFEHAARGLSVKSVLGGVEEFRIEHGLHKVQPDQLLVINSGQRYGSQATAAAPEMETYCVSFGQRLLGEVYRACSAPLRNLLDDPAASGKAPELVETIYAPHTGLLPLVGRTRQLLGEHPSSLELEETALHLLERLLCQDDGLHAHSLQLGIQNPRLRRETLQRLFRARDTMLARGGGSLSEWAEVACLSRFHFLRLFKRVFQSTPGQYLIGLRLDHARRELRASRRSILEVALNAGFQSASQFSTAFRRHFGVSPRQWRQG